VPADVRRATGRFGARIAGTRPRMRLVAGLIAAAILLDGGVVVAIPTLGAASIAAQNAADRARTLSAEDASATAASRGATGALQNPTSSSATKVGTATPTRVIIPTIDVNAHLQRLAMNAAGELQPPDNWTDAGWYAKGVVPGQTGAAVIAGHLDTTERAAVFVALRFLRPGDPIHVEMSNGKTVSFTVTRTQVVGKSVFPTAAVYGPTPDAELRLITCSEPFDDVHGVYADNLVVYATKT
jgi:sortase (surface protein transpeptidase)